MSALLMVLHGVMLNKVVVVPALLCAAHPTP
jgi:hypothetical protein